MREYAGNEADLIIHKEPYIHLISTSETTAYFRHYQWGTQRACEVWYSVSLINQIRKADSEVLYFPLDLSVSELTAECNAYVNTIFARYEKLLRGVPRGTYPRADRVPMKNREKRRIGHSGGAGAQHKNGWDRLREEMKLNGGNN